MATNTPSSTSNGLASRALRVAVDCRLMYYRRAGIAQYTRHLVTGLAQTLTTYGPARLSVIVDRRDRDTSWIPPGIGRWRTITPAHHRYEHLLFPLELARLNRHFDVLHSPDLIAARGRFRKVITIHDLFFMEHPEVMTASGARYYGRIHASAQAASRIIAVSEFTRREIARLLPEIDPVKVDVVYEAAANPLAATNLEPPVAQTSYALFVGTFEPRKNLVTLLRALKESPPDMKLVIVGESGWGNGQPGRLANELGLGERVKFAGRVSDLELDKVYRGARLLALPSLSEGFGLPVLEAMVRGVPVVCSNAGALPEVAGDAALMHDPLDTAGMARLMRMVWTIDPVQADYARRGLQRARQFSWSAAALATWRVYQSAQSA